MPPETNPSTGIADPWRIRVLIVDDTTSDRAWIASLVGQMDEYDATPTLAASIAEARALIGTLAFDLALVDYNLGPGYGDEVIADIVERQPRCATILVSSHIMSEVSLFGLKAGATAALSKDDINPTLLETTIRFALANRARTVASGA